MIGRRCKSFLALLAIIACDDSTAPEPVGIMWGSGASGAFVGDSIPLVVFYRDPTGEPIGLPRPSVAWTSSRPSVLSVLSESLAVALDTGLVVLTAATTTGSSYLLTVAFEIVPQWHGRLVWSRQPQPGEQPAIVSRDLPSHNIREFDVGFPRAGSGDAAMSWDGTRASATGTRTSASGAPVTVFVIDLASGGVTAPFNSQPGDQFGSAWLPGDTLIAFLMRTATGVDVFTGNPTGGGVQVRTALRQGSPPFFTITADGNLVIALRASGANAQSDLFEMTLSGDTVRRLTSTADYHEGGGSVSPKDDLIVYSASEVDGDFGHVWIRNRDGTSPRRLLPTVRVPNGLGPPFYNVEAVEQSPSWTPNGEWILLSWTVDSHLRPDGLAYEALGELYAIRVADRLAVRLTRSRTIDGQPVFR